MLIWYKMPVGRTQATCSRKLTLINLSSVEVKEAREEMLELRTRRSMLWEGHAPFWVKLMGSATQFATYMRWAWNHRSACEKREV